MEWTAHVEDVEDRLHIVQELFALITSLCEDASEIAMTGQSCSDAAAISRLAALLAEAGQRVMIVANAVRAIPLPSRPN